MKIEDNVPAPAISANANRTWPFKNMAVKQSVLIEAADVKLAKAAYFSVSRYSGGAIQFVHEIYPNKTMRVWRTK